MASRPATSRRDQSSQQATTRCDVCREAGRAGLSVRHAGPGDREHLRALYETLPPQDLVTRFFTAGVPNDRLLERWTDLESHGGLCLLLESDSGAEPQVVAEAGYAPLLNGDVELGISVAPNHRGQTGTWLLDLLLDHAAAAGFENLEAIVKTSNKPMLSIINRRGCVRFDDSDWETAKLTISTTGGTPSWPPRSQRPRVLVESTAGRPDVARRVRAESGTTLICTGFNNESANCPLRDDLPCPLIAGADAVVIDGCTGRETALDPSAVAVAIAHVHPEANIVAVDSNNVGDLPRRDTAIDLKLAAHPTNRSEERHDDAIKGTH